MYNCSSDVGELSNLERQALPLNRQVTLYLPTPNGLGKPKGQPQSEAGNRAQSVENKQVTTLALTRRWHG
ncbi:hypothetical protein [Fischerella sp. PCC 9605]|uniref:hypothetical protein n=1 Tax=Fischerella sp. PCC 9605 TaxID=1173024 RepID=UPI0018CC7A20|nr:hypothetical protein [Fischerella sp. PCC 9605]